MRKPISDIGLGKIGTPLALALAAKDFWVRLPTTYQMAKFTI
jgi:UDP-N-acetyl-D-mannosaminuronate dehydrogenase